jgi:hypothetical protein
VEGLEPLMQGNVATFHDRSHGHGEILAAALFGAAEYPGALRGIGVIDGAAVRTDWAFRP